MDDKTTRPLEDSADIDRTIVIPRDDADVDRTIVIPQNPAVASAPPPPPPESARPGRTTDTRHSILSDLGNFLFPRRRTVVDETIELIGAASSEPETAPDDPDSQTPLADVETRYALAAEPFAGGGQGRISRAVDRALGCEVAVKSLHDKLCSDARARSDFLNEARLTASLDHPAIIPIHGLFGDGGNGMHLAMKLISGHTLSRYLKSIVTMYEKKGIGRFDEKKSLRNRISIFLRVCDALEYAHARKVIHRDLKLENIMIGKHRETYVTDWGLAMHLKDAENLPKLNGTPGFIAPEVLTTRKADIRSDIYSLGIILFELVTLTPAFSDTELTTLLNRVKIGQHAPLRHRFGCHIDADLKAIIRKAIALDPDRRYQRVSDLAEDLRRYLTNEETTARPDNLFGKLCRWGVNHRRGMLLTTMAILLLAIAAVARTLHKEIRWSAEQRLRDHAVGDAYGRLITTANELEKSLDNIEYRLEQFRTNILFSALKIELPDSPGRRAGFVPMERYRTDPPKSFRYAKSYRHRIDSDGACVFSSIPGGKLDLAQLKFFGNTVNFMREALLDPQKIGEKAALDRLFNDGRPIKKIYFTLTDGTFACYPGSLDDFPAGYDPATRPWFIAARNAPGRIVWSGPYEDSGIHRDAMLTCAVRINGADGRCIGTAAIDFSLTKLAEKMLNPSSTYYRFTREKLLINREGKVIFRMIPPGRADIRPLRDPAIIRYMRAKKFGTLITRQGGRELLLAFSCITPIDVIYAEVLDMATLVNHERGRQ